MIWRARVQSSRFARAIILGELPRCWRERNAKRPDQSEEGRVGGVWTVGRGSLSLASQTHFRKRGKGMVNSVYKYCPTGMQLAG